MIAYNTLSEAIRGFQSRGYTLDFNLAFDHVKCAHSGICLYPDQFEIVGVHRFEGETNPSDSSILYLIESKDGKQKGLMVSAYGVYADPVDAQLLQKLQVHYH